MTTFVEYNIITKADVKIVGTPAYYSSEDNYQQQTSYNNGGNDPTLSVERLDLLIKPTLSSAPNVNRIVNINLDELQVDYLQILHIKCDKYFLFSFADTLTNLQNKPRELVKVVFKDYGTYPAAITQAGWTPDVPYPKHLRLMNPLDINGGGSGNDSSDIPIHVQVHMITKKFDS